MRHKKRRRRSSLHPVWYVYRTHTLSGAQMHAANERQSRKAYDPADSIFWAALRDKERNWPKAHAEDMATMTGDWSEYIMRYGSEDE